MVTNEQVMKKLVEIEGLLLAVQEKESKEPKGLWDIQDIADYSGFSYRHTYGNIISDPRFPAPVNLQSRTGGKCKPLFVKDEVIEFFVKNKKKKHRI
ncbi:hypothetical protein [Necropsobacter rosorum]|uniref:hypothetical protein n=1 Tax=Necropsobacter rosorum TaxID=908285 RepID=UPI0005095BE2